MLNDGACPLLGGVGVPCKAKEASRQGGDAARDGACRPPSPEGRRVHVPVARRPPPNHRHAHSPLALPTSSAHAGPSTHGPLSDHPARDSAPCGPAWPGVTSSPAVPPRAPGRTPGCLWCSPGSTGLLVGCPGCCASAVESSRFGERGVRGDRPRRPQHMRTVTSFMRCCSPVQSAPAARAHSPRRPESFPSGEAPFSASSSGRPLSPPPVPPAPSTADCPREGPLAAVAAPACAHTRTAGMRV